MANIITGEELNSVLLASPMTMPDSPSNAGMSAGQIKKHFYKFIISLVNIINEKLSNAETAQKSGLSEHNASAASHADMRDTLSTLTALCNALGTQVGGIMGDHNTSDTSHADIRSLLAETAETAQNALVIAQGNSKAAVYATLDDMKNELLSGEVSLNVGDTIYIEAKKVPDFWVAEKSDTPYETTVPDELSNGVHVKIGRYDLVSFEDGIDASVLAKKAELDSLSSVVAKKENARETLTVALPGFFPEGDKEYNCGVKTTLTLDFSQDTPEKYSAIVNFISPQSPTEFYANGALFYGDDCCGGTFIPVKNRLYEINLKKACGSIVGVVGGVDYEIL